MMRLLAWMVLCVPQLVSATEAPFPTSAKSLACDMRPAGADILEFKCPFEANGAVQRLRFKADFLGSHDDTTASMNLHLNGAPLVCDSGSKTQLMGEFGEVSLDCQFQMKGKAGKELLLSITLQWFHARYSDADFSVVRE